MSGLEINEGLQLFSWHAFLRASPSLSHEHLSKGIVEACKGHPLSLEVIGSFLYDKQDDTACWTEALHNITVIPDIQKRVHNTLKISYDALSNGEREIFLDIACLFIGENKTLPIVFWKSLYKTAETAVSNLSMKLLIKIDDEGAFNMHDHLRDLGQTIAENEREGTRLWKADYLNTLSNNINVSRLRLNGGNPQRLEMLYRPGLRYLHLQNVRIEGMTEDTPAMLPASLIWLRLEDCIFSIGNNRATNKILTAASKTYRALKKKDRSKIVGNIKQLKIMQLTNSNIHSISHLISPLNVEQMQYLDLTECNWLNKLPDTIGNLSQLQHLDLKMCCSLNKLPDTIGNLSQLQHLDLRWCERLNKLPETIGNLSQLQHLDLYRSMRFKKLPDTIGNLSQLQHLDLTKCYSLNKLSDTIGNLSQLRHLHLKFCEKLNMLSDNISNLSQLQHLDLEGFESLYKLPDTIGNLLQLQHLDLERCKSLNEFPDTIGNLSQLQHLNVGMCESLNELPDTIGNLSQLRHLDLKFCEKLNKLPDTIGNLSQLQHLDLGWCKSLNKLPDTIGNLSQLGHLDVRGCISLNELPDTIDNKEF